MKKVAFYVNMPSPYRVDFFNLLGKYCDLYVFFEMDKSPTRNDSWQSYDFKNFKGILLKGISYSGESAFCPSIIKEYKKLKPDINIVCNFSSLTGIKLINFFIRHHIEYLVEGDGAFNRKDNNLLKKHIKNRAFSNASKLFYTSDEHLKYLLSYKAKKANTVLYPFSSIHETDICELNEVLKMRKKEKESLNIDNKFTIITVGRFLKLKNIDLLLKAFKNFDDTCQLLVIGGRPTEEYKSIIDSLSIKNVTFVDFVSKDKLYKYLRASDLFVFTSVLDVWGLVINEAMANGLPIISSDKALGAVQMSLNNKGISLYKAGNLDELVKQISRFLDCSKDERKGFIKSNLLKIHDYTLEKMCDKHVEVLKLI